MGSNAAVRKNVHGPAQPASQVANQSVYRRVWLARGVMDGFKGELVAACVFCGLTDVIFASAVGSVGRREKYSVLGGRWAMSEDVKAARSRGIWDGVVGVGGRSGGKTKEGHGFCSTLLCVDGSCFFRRPWQPHPSSSSTTANVTLNQRLQP